MYDKIPTDFKYTDVLKAGMPVHKTGDPFYTKHPPMPLGQRAKIFSPFDALKGFSEAIDEAETKHRK